MYIDPGEDEPAEMEEALGKLVEDAKQNGLSKERANRLQSMLHKYQIFGYGWEKPNQPMLSQ